MSNVIHNRVRFILMVIVAIVAHESLPGSTVNAHYNGYTDSKKQRGTATQIQMQAVAPAEQLHTVDTTANLNRLLEQLNRNQFGNSIGGNTSYRDKVRADAGRPILRSYNANTKLLHWLSKNSPKQDLLVSSALAARHKDEQDIRLQRIESNAADRAFERLIKMNLKQEQTDESLADKKVETKNLHAPFFNFCKATSKPTSVGRKEQSCPAPKPIKTCQKKGKRKLQRMLKLAKTMKRRACLIIKKLNLLECEIHKRWPGAKSSDHKNRIQSGKPTAPPPPPPPPPPAQSQNVPPPGGKQQERLDRPTPGPATQSPFKHNRGFYFGLSPPGEDNNEENLAAALREEQKLEQKVLEELQMQRDRDDKIKRARYEAAPPAAARIEYFITTPASRRNNWHHVNNTVTKRNKENLNSIIPVDNSISLKRLKTQLQRVLRQHKRARHRIKLHQ